MKALILLCLIAGTSLASDNLQFEIEDHKGNRLSEQDFSGQWLLVNYWASWCKPCIAEMPELDALARENPLVSVIGLSMDETMGDLEIYLARHPVQYPVALFDPANKPPGNLPMARVLPTSYLYSPSGHLVEKWPGKITREQVENRIHQGTEP